MAQLTASAAALPALGAPALMKQRRVGPATAPAAIERRRSARRSLGRMRRRSPTLGSASSPWKGQRRRGGQPRRLAPLDRSAAAAHTNHRRRRRPTRLLFPPICPPIFCNYRRRSRVHFSNNVFVASSQFLPPTPSLYTIMRANYHDDIHCIDIS